MVLWMQADLEEAMVVAADLTNLALLVSIRAVILIVRMIKWLYLSRRWVRRTGRDRSRGKRLEHSLFSGQYMQHDR